MNANEVETGFGHDERLFAQESDEDVRTFLLTGGTAAAASRGNSGLSRSLSMSSSRRSSASDALDLGASLGGKADGKMVVKLDKVLGIVEELQRERSNKLFWKRWLGFSTLLGSVLLVSVFGLMWTTVTLTRHVSKINAAQNLPAVSVNGQQPIAATKGLTLHVHTDPQEQRTRRLQTGRKFQGRINKVEVDPLLSNPQLPINLVFLNTVNVTFDTLIDSTRGFTVSQFADLSYRVSNLAAVDNGGNPINTDLFYHIDCPKDTGSQTKCEVYETIPFVAVVSGVSRKKARIWFRTDGPANDVHVILSSTDMLNVNLYDSRFPAQNGVSTNQASDYTGSIVVLNLQPNRKYYYKVVVDGAILVDGLREVPYFRTLPAPGNEFVFNVFADAAKFFADSGSLAYMAGGGQGASTDPHFALQIGDFDHSDPTNLAEIRNMNRILRDPTRLHGRQLAKHILSKMAFTHIWDDHDYCGNDSDRHCTFKQEAMQAYKEYYPGYDLAQPDHGIWFKFMAGDAEVFVLDTRTQRDTDTLPDPDNNPAFQKSMLDGYHLDSSTSQLDWLLDGIRTSTARWKIVVSTVTANMSARRNNFDHWVTGFKSEANHIKNYLATHHLAQDVLMISADLHSGGTIDDGCNNGWGVAEVGVPHTNLINGNSDNIGVWNVGLSTGATGPGFARITVSPQYLKVEVVGDDAVVRHQTQLPISNPNTGCSEPDDNGFLIRCSGNVHQFPTPLVIPENVNCGMLDPAITYQPPFPGTQGPLINKMEVWNCQASGKRIILANDIPNHSIMRENPNQLCEIPYYIELPLNPQVMPHDLIFEPSNVIGLSTEGVIAYNALENGNNNAVVPDDPNHVQDAKFWYGHADAKKNYHYHAPWLGRHDYAQLTEFDHLGWAMDGFPIYGPVDDPDNELDECNFRNGKYHIRRINQVDDTLPYCKSTGEESVNWKYVIGCFRGNVRLSAIKDATSSNAVHPSLLGCVLQ